MSKGDRLERPTKTTDYSIFFGSSHAEKGWRDLKAVRPNGLADAWEYLTKSPERTAPHCYPLKGELGIISRKGKSFERWQIELNSKGDARIWYYVDDKKVIFEKVHTHHPNQTK